MDTRGPLGRDRPPDASRDLPSPAKAWILAALSFLFFEFSSTTSENGQTTSSTKIVVPFGLVFALWCFLAVSHVAREARRLGRPLPRVHQLAGLVAVLAVVWLVFVSLKEMVF
jgi:hypothetical protein